MVSRRSFGTAVSNSGSIQSFADAMPSRSPARRQIRRRRSDPVKSTSRDRKDGGALDRGDSAALTAQHFYRVRDILGATSATAARSRRRRDRRSSLRVDLENAETPAVGSGSSGFGSMRESRRCGCSARQRIGEPRPHGVGKTSERTLDRTAAQHPHRHLAGTNPGNFASLASLSEALTDLGLDRRSGTDMVSLRSSWRGFQMVCMRVESLLCESMVRKGGLEPHGSPLEPKSSASTNSPLSQMLSPTEQYSRTRACSPEESPAPAVTFPGNVVL